MLRNAGFYILIMLSGMFSMLVAQEEYFGVEALSSAVDTAITPQAAYRKKPQIAVLPFANANAKAKEAEFGRTVSSMLATSLRNQTNFVVLERSQLNEIFSDIDLERSGLTRERTAELRRFHNVEVILVGDVSMINGTLHIDLRLIETQTAEIVVALFGTCHDLKKIRGVIEDLTEQLQKTYLRQWMGSISITSSPAGAEVYLDAKFIGLTDRNEALRITDLLEGTYDLKLIRGGYFDWQGEIAVPAKMERAVEISLIAKPGSMNIYSEPAGAQVFLDNNEAGKTPLSLKSVAEGEHEIKLELENFKPWTQKVIVRSFQPTDVKAILEVSPGTLTVNSIPGGADIYLKGELVAESPHTILNIPPGEIAIRIEKVGYEAWTSAVFIQPNHTEILDVRLEEKVGSVSITSLPDSAIVYLSRFGNGTRQKIGATPILGYKTPIGMYHVEVEKDDYFIDRGQMTVKHRKLSEKRMNLVEKPGTILIETTPANARVLLDGTFQGRSPLVLDNVEKGEHEVTLSLPYAIEEKNILVKPNRQTDVRTNFRKSGNYILAATSIGVAGFLFHLLAGN